MADVNIGQLAATVYEDHYPSDPTDNIIKSTALWKALTTEGFKNQADGGRTFGTTVEFAENTTNAMIAETGVIDTTRITVFDEARYDQKIAAGTIVFTQLELLQARGDNAKIDLVASKLENGRKSHRALLNRQGWNTVAPGANELTSVPIIIPTDPTTGTVGGINAATYTWWRSQTNDGTKTTTVYDNLQAVTRKTWDQCSLGGSEMTPNAMVSDLATFAGFEGTLFTLLRYRSEDLSSADSGFKNQGLTYKGSSFYYDEDAPANKIHILNNKALWFRYLAWFKLSDPINPANQLMSVYQIYTVGNFVCGARRHLGVVYNAAS